MCCSMIRHATVLFSFSFAAVLAASAFAQRELKDIPDPDFYLDARLH